MGKLIAAKALLKENAQKFGRASEDERLEMIGRATSYADGGDTPAALACLVLAEFEDGAYYNEIGKDPLSTAACNYWSLKLDLILDGMGFIRKRYYRWLMGRMYGYLERIYFK